MSFAFYIYRTTTPEGAVKQRNLKVSLFYPPVFAFAACLIIQAIPPVRFIGHVTGNFRAAAFGTLGPGMLASPAFIIIYITGIVSNIYVSTAWTLETGRKGTHIFFR